MIREKKIKKKKTQIRNETPIDKHNNKQEQEQQFNEIKESSLKEASKQATKKKH